MSANQIESAAIGPWSKGKFVKKAPLRWKEICGIRTRLQLQHQPRNLTFVNLAIDSKLRSCDLLNIRVCDIPQANRVLPRAIVMR